MCITYNEKTKLSLLYLTSLRSLDIVPVIFVGKYVLFIARSDVISTSPHAAMYVADLLQGVDRSVCVLIVCKGISIVFGSIGGGS